MEKKNKKQKKQKKLSPLVESIVEEWETAEEDGVLTHWEAIQVHLRTAVDLFRMQTIYKKSGWLIPP